MKSFLLTEKVKVEVGGENLIWVKKIFFCLGKNKIEL
jgi:hypothetical protein